MESSASSGGSSDEDSFDEEGPATYHEWKAFVVKTYLNGKEPVRQIYAVPEVFLPKGQENKIQTPPPPPPTPKPHYQQQQQQQQQHHHQQPSSRPNSRPPFQVQQPQPLPYPKNQLKHQLPPQPNRSDGNNLKAKVAKKANQPGPQSSKPNPLDKQKDTDSRQFKIPDRDASGNPVRFHTTTNPYSLTKSTTIVNNSPTLTRSNSNTSMTSNQNFATVTSSLNKTTSVQMSSSIPSSSSSSLSSSSSSSTTTTTTATTLPSSRVTKGSTYPENNAIPIAKPIPAAHLKTRSDVFWSLNSAAKLLHVKSQLDEPSKIYVDKLVKNNGVAQREILKLRKDKSDLLNTIKMVEKIISNPTAVHHSS